MLAALLLAPVLSGCAPKPQAGDPEAAADARENNDPYERLNRKSFAVQDALDRHVLRPVAIAYRDTLPGGVRTHVHDLLSNLGNPAQLVNDVMQARPRKAGNTFMRLLLNTTVGVGGVFDVAAGLGFPDHDNDFGLTLAVWGVGSGPYLFLPVLGPSNPRDGVGYGINSTFDPLTWASFGGSKALGYSRFALGAADARARVLKDTDTIDKTALDRYATYRSLSQQHRAGEVKAAMHDLPATVPSWYSGRANNPSPPTSAPQEPTKQLAPPPKLTP